MTYEKRLESNIIEQGVGGGERDRDVQESGVSH